MKRLSILNDVLGPVMRGPSSSHTAGPFFIASLARELLGQAPAEVRITFAPAGSFAEVYRQQGSDLGFAAGLLGWSITDERFPHALELAAEQGLRLEFVVAPLPGADHPNSVELLLTAPGGRTLRFLARSIGGGTVEIVRLQEWPVLLTGSAYEVLVEMDRGKAEVAARLLAEAEALAPLERQERAGITLLHARLAAPIADSLRVRLAALPGVRELWTAAPLSFVQRGRPLFTSAAGMLAWAAEQRCPLGQAALAYESALLGMSEKAVLAECSYRLEVMQAAVRQGLGDDLTMPLLQPSAGQVLRAEAADRVAVGGLTTRAAARAMAGLHTNCAMGVVCAAPTGGASGVIPGALVTLMEEKGLSQEKALLSLLAAGAVGLIFGTRATFAAEIAGCQVEIGIAGAMAAAAVVEAAGGSSAQTCDAAAVSLQNSQGWSCDPVQGIVEIPCHTRSAVATASAFICADLVLGGYSNPIPLDETIDAAYNAGKMLPRELRCTALGGLSLAPSGCSMRRQR